MYLWLGTLYKNGNKTALQVGQIHNCVYYIGVCEMFANNTNDYTL